MTRRLLASGIAILVLLGIGFIGFRYTSAISEKNRLEQKRIDLEFKKLEQEKEIREFNAEQDRLKEEIKIQAQREDAEAREEKYSSCIDAANEQYDRSWRNNCMVLSEKNKTEYADCFERCSNSTAKFACADGGDPARFCRDMYPSVSPTDCRALPAKIADPITKSRDKARDTCLQLYK